MASSSNTAAQIPSHTAPSKIDILNNLQNTPWHLRFSKNLESHFERSQQAQRKRELVLYGFIGLFVYLSFLINDWLMRPETFSEALLWRGVAMAYGTSILLTIARTYSPQLREFLINSAVVVITFCSCQIFAATESSIASYDPFVFSLIFMAFNTLLSLRFVHAIVSAILCVILTLFYVLTHAFIDPDAISFIAGLLVGTAVFSLSGCYRIEYSQRQLFLVDLFEEVRAKEAQEPDMSYKKLTLTDPLTQVPNRKAFEHKFELLSTHNKRNGENAFAVLMVDIDHFKRFNDNLGHIAGDACLIKVAQAIRSVLRKDDLLARYGGEEFIILLPKSDTHYTNKVCQRLRQTVESLNLTYQVNDIDYLITISMGAAIVNTTKPVSIKPLIKQIDTLLLQAKENGRNNSVVAEFN